MRQAGRYLPEYRALRQGVGSFLELCYAPHLAAEDTLQPVRRFGFDAAILFSDILVVPHALGVEVEFVEGKGPSLAPVNDEAGVASLAPERTEERLGPVYETVQRVRDALPDGVALIGFAGAPWTVAAYMVEGGTSSDFMKARRWAVGDPQGFGALIECLVEATATHLCRQVASGAEALQIFESHAGLLGEEAFERWVVAPTAEIVRRVRTAFPEVPIIGFPRGAGLLCERYLAATGVTALSLDSTVPLAWAGRLQEQVPVQGNLDPACLLAGGAALESAVRRRLGALGGGPFIFNLGHGIDKETPVGHVEALVTMVRNARGES